MEATWRLPCLLNGDFAHSSRNLKAIIAPFSCT